MGNYILGSKKRKVAEEICAKLNAEDRLTAHNLVEVSRPEDAPLHSEFEWDDSIAGEKYREHQARNIIRHITIYTEYKEPVRKYFHIYREEPNYHSIEVVFQQPDMRAQLLKNAKRDMEIFRHKYLQLTELTAVFKAMEEVINSDEQPPR